MNKNRQNYVQIEITTKCNAHCAYCDYNRRRSQSTADISMQKYFLILNKINHITEIVHLQGLGEPFLNHNFMKLIKIAKYLGFKVGTTSNMTVWDTDAISALDYLYVSVDAIVGGKKNEREGIKLYDVWENIMRLLAMADRPDVYLNAVVTNNNVVSIVELLHHCSEHELPFSGISLFPVINFKDPKTLLTRNTRNKVRKAFETTNLSHVQIPFLIDKPKRKCYWLTDRYYFDIRGNLKICCLRNGNNHPFISFNEKSTIREVSAKLKKNLPDDVCDICIRNKANLAWKD